jgi:hypothetical protein
MGKLTHFAIFTITDMTYDTLTDVNHRLSETLIHAALRCRMCEEWHRRTDMTAGPYCADGRLGFVCNEHVRNFRQIVNLLADFMADERQRYLERKDLSRMKLNEKGPDVWFLH